MTLDALLRIHREQIFAIAARHGRERGRDLFDHGQLQMDLEELLGRKVHVVTERGLAPHLRDRVLREAIPL